MRRLLWLIALLSACGGDAGPRLQNPFVSFQFGLDEQAPAAQVALLRDLGYDGIAFWGAEDRLAARLGDYEAAAAGGLRVIAWHPQLEYQRYDARAAQAWLGALGARGAIFWPILLETEGLAPDAGKLASVVSDLAERAARAGTRVVLYPHYETAIDDVEQSLEVIRSTGRGDVFTSLHLCHELRAGHLDRLPEIIERAAPRLALASISGAASRPRTGPGLVDWGDVIGRLDESELDLLRFLRPLLGAGYRGPIALHTYGLAGDPRELREAAMRRWRQLARTLVEEGLATAR